MPVNKSLITVIVEAIGAGAALALIYNVLRVMHLNAYGADKMSMFLCPLAAFKLLQTVVSRFFTLQAPAASTIETDITVPNDKHLIPEEKVVFQTPDIAAKRTLQAASSGQFEHKEYAKVFPVNRVRVNPIIVNYNEAIDSVANFENESSPKVVESQEKSVPKTEDIVKIDSKTSDELPWIKYAKTFPAESPLVHPSEPLRWHPKGVLQSKVTNPSPIRSPSYIQEKIPQQIALDMDRTTQELMNVASGFQLAQALFGMYPIADENSVEKDKAENRVDGKKTQGKVSLIKRSYSMGNLREMF